MKKPKTYKDRDKKKRKEKEKRKERSFQKLYFLLLFYLAKESADSGPKKNWSIFPQNFNQTKKSFYFQPNKN